MDKIKITCDDCGEIFEGCISCSVSTLCEFKNTHWATENYEGCARADCCARWNDDTPDFDSDEWNSWSWAKRVFRLKYGSKKIQYN
jgi:hypothetical protein